MSTERDSTSAVLVDALGGLLLDPPNELRFKGPFDDYVTVSLSIKNPTEKRIAFKIKTTAPKRYCVKPNSGVLDPAQSMKVNVLLQPFNYDPSEKNKHKFMVQYLYLNDQEMQLSVNDILNMWKDVPTSRLLDLKLKCLFEFNENESQKLTQQQQNQDAKPQQQQQQQQKQSTSNNTTNQLANNTNLSTAPRQPTSLSTRSSNVSDIYSNAAESTSNDFDSTPNNSTVVANNNNNNPNKLVNNTNTANSGVPSTESISPIVASTTRVEKNDNTINELKLARQENDLLKKEINRLKEEEARLRKLALQSSSSGSGGVRSNNPNSLEINSVADILNNRLLMIIIVLVAVIVYLLLFR